MPPATRSQTAFRESLAASDVPPTIALPPANGEIRHDLTDGNNNLTAGMRMRRGASTQFESQGQPSTSTNGRDRTTASRASSSKSVQPPLADAPDTPPRFTIDLSLPPEQRYLAVCAAFQSEIADLVPLFDEVVGEMLHYIPLTWLHRACRLLLRGVYDGEEQAELKGISEATGVRMYLLVAFNVLLDLFMGCSSGGAAVGTGEGEGERKGSKMLHFRTLDWGMPSLRRVVVQLDFVLETHGPVFASSITYAGYVGVLTGVREGLSMSLNFRPNRIDNGVFWADVKYMWHLICVLMGWRRSISSTIRGFLLPRTRRRGWKGLRKAVQGRKDGLLEYDDVVKEMGGDGSTGKRPATTTACYFCVCNGKETTITEKDRISANVRSGDEFIVVTNTDESPPSSTSPAAATEKLAAKPITKSDELVELLAEAQDRQECALHNWRNLQSRKARKRRLQHISGDERKRLLSVEDVVWLTQQYPTTNECTHFAAVMDPMEGKVVWCRRWRDPVGAEWVEEHMGGTR